MNRISITSSLLLILLVLFCLPSPLPAQPKSTAARDLRLRLDSEYRLRRAEAESIATALRLPIRKVAGDGRTIELQRFVNGAPLYYVTDNINSGKTISSDLVYPGGAAGYSLTGFGMVLGEWDAGGVRTSHQEFGGRVATSEGALHRHSTHVAGTMIAAGVQPNARGMAYGAILKAYDWNNDLTEMTAQAEAGLRVSNHSYGFVTGWEYNYRGDGLWAWFGDTGVSQVEDYKFGYYSTESRDWDAVAYNSPYLLIVKSAGNDRNDGPGGPVKHWIWNGSWDTVVAARNKDGNSGYDCIDGAAVSKNPLVVGAVADLPGGYSTPSGVVMSSFSAWGPTDDGRIKPDVVANGVGLYSTFEGSNTAYGTYSGTSMAAPSVAGSVGLLLEHEQNLHPGDSLRASTLKAIIINTADEAGTDPGPDYRFGWGLMNTRKAADLMTLDTVDGAGSHVSELTLANGDTLLVDIASSGMEPLKATICWADPGIGTAPVSLDPPNIMLKNDLDLRLIRKSNGTVSSPWTLNPGSPSAAAGTGDNIRDNVEQVFVADPGRTLYTLRITHKGSLISGPVRVSLAVSGNVPSLGPALSVATDSVGYSLVPGAVLGDSLTLYNEGDTTLRAMVTKDPGSFWISLTEDSVSIPAFDSARVHYTLDGALWSQWTDYSGTITLTSSDTAASPLETAVSVEVLGPTVSPSKSFFVILLDSAEIGTDTLRVRNPGYIPLDVVVHDSSGVLPSWLAVAPDSFTVPPGDSVAVVLTTNPGNEPLGDYATDLRITSNDSSTGPLLVPVFMNIGTRTLYQVGVTSRWNMISLPVEPITGLKTVLFPGASTAAFGFNGGYYQADTLETGPGYWIKFPSAGSVDIDGFLYSADTIPVFTGWNMVGSVSESVPVAGVVTSPEGIIASMWYGYDGGYIRSDSIVPGKAYWVQVSADGEIYLGGPPAAAPKARPAVDAGTVNSLTIADREGNSQTLWFGGTEPAPGITTLPPAPPAGAFDVRFAGDISYGSFTGGGNDDRSLQAFVSSPAGEVTVTPALAALEAGESITLVDGGGKTYPLTDGSPVTVPVERGGAKTEFRIVRGGEGLPAEYALDQNYPNPFNPVTTISFALPEDALVSVKIFNILGSEVGSVAAKRYPAGRHAVTFDAGALPSGVYLYAMRAGTFSMTRKMVLMR